MDGVLFAGAKAVFGDDGVDEALMGLAGFGASGRPRLARAASLTVLLTVNHIWFVSTWWTRGVHVVDYFLSTWWTSRVSLRD